MGETKNKEISNGNFHELPEKSDKGDSETIQETDGGMSSKASAASIEKVERQSVLKKFRNRMVHFLEEALYSIGLLIAKHPIKTAVIVPILCTLCAVGFIRYRLDEDFANLLLPPTSRIHREKHWIENNIPISFRPVRMIFKTNDVLNQEFLLKLLDVQEQVSKLVTSGNVTYENVCGRINGKCYVASLLEIWSYDRNRLKRATKEEIVQKVHVTETSPVYLSPFYGFRLLGEQQTDKQGRIYKASVTTMTWLLQTNVSIQDEIIDFERKMVRIAEEHNELFEKVYIFNLNSFEESFFEAVNKDVYLLAFGFPLVLLYLVVSLGQCNLLEHKVYLTFVALIGVGLSGCVSFGLCLAGNLIFGTSHQALMFLLLAIGVDDVYVIMESWKRVRLQHPELPITESIALTVKHAGVSVTLTSVSNFVSFASGISTVMPVLQSFCVYAAVGILALLIIQTTLFPALLVIDARRIQAVRNACLPCLKHNNYKPSTLCSKFEIVNPYFKDIHGRAIINPVAKVIIILVTLGLTGVMIWGVVSMKKGFDLEKTLSDGSHGRDFLYAQRLYFPDEGPNIGVYCNYMDYHTNIDNIDLLVRRLLNNSNTLKGTLIPWTDPFKVWASLQQNINRSIALTAAGYFQDKAMFREEMYNFFHHVDLGKAYKQFIFFDYDSSPPLARATYIPGQQIRTENADKDLVSMESMRKTVDEIGFEGGECFVYSDFYIFFETIEYLPEEIMKSFLIASVCVVLVNFLLLVDLTTSILVFLCVILTTIDVIGTLHFIGFTLEQNMVILLVFSIGLSVDFSAHFGYMFLTVKGSRNFRTKESLRLIGPAVFHGAFTTFLAFVVMAWAESYFFQLFFSAIMTVVLYGLFHGLCFLPVILSLIGSSSYDQYADKVNLMGNLNQVQYNGDSLSPTATHSDGLAPKALQESKEGAKRETSFSDSDITLHLEKTKPCFTGTDHTSLKDMQNISTDECDENATALCNPYTLVAGENEYTEVERL
ncbi:hypothetical protein ACJMK2_040260 [Sinanodonta woodiana]|uniref:SSD domain-containing protein n=1 Tax=Sinanodonta woodiana TaxID=1069815 RepID=A0ABD3WEI0_SINWO